MEVVGVAPARWRSEFNRQATDSTMEAVFNYARSLRGQLEARTGRADPMSAEDRVNAAIVGTLDGRFRWDPERGELAPHLMWAVKRAAFHELRRAARFTHVSLDADGTETTEREVSDALAAERETREEAVRICFTLWAKQMRTLAAGDRPLLRLLDAYDEGAFERQDVLAVAQMSARTYHSALQRLKRLARKLPNESHDAAIDAIAGGESR